MTKSRGHFKTVYSAETLCWVCGSQLAPRRHAATLRTRHPYPLVLRTQIIAEGRTAVTATVVIVIVTEEEVEVRGVGGGVR